MISKAIISLAVFAVLFGLYKWLLAESGRFKLNRWILLTIPVICLALPFIEFNSETVAQTIVLPEYRVAAEATVDRSVEPAIDWISLIYLIGCGVTFTLLVIRLIATVRKSEADSGFSFFNKILVNDQLDSETKNAVHDHELIHLKQMHSMDLIIMELVGVVWWFNPLFFLLKKEVKLNHEYEADAAVSHDREDYSKMLVSQYFQVDQSLLGHSFSMSNLKKRLIMMNREKKNWSGKYLLFAVLCAGTIGLTSWGPVNGMPDPTEDQPEVIQDDVDVMPEFPGGQKAMITYMTENITYPETAKKNGVEGKVYVSFVVSSSGKINSIKVKNTDADSDLQKEAIRVIKNMPDWEPGTKDGKAVSTEMLLPIVFKLPKEE